MFCVSLLLEKMGESPSTREQDMKLGRTFSTNRFPVPSHPWPTAMSAAKRINGLVPLGFPVLLPSIAGDVCSQFVSVMGVSGKRYAFSALTMDEADYADHAIFMFRMGLQRDQLWTGTHTDLMRLRDSFPAGEALDVPLYVHLLAGNETTCARILRDLAPRRYAGDAGLILETEPDFSDAPRSSHTLLPAGGHECQGFSDARPC